MVAQRSSNDYTNDDLRSMGRRLEATPLQYRLYVVETWIAHLVNDPERLQTVIESILRVNEPVSAEVEELRQTLAADFEKALRSEINSRGEGLTGEARLVGEDLLPVPEVNEYVGAMLESLAPSSRTGFHPLAERPTLEQVYGEIRLHYYLERELIAPVFVGFTDRVLSLFRCGHLGDCIIWVMRDALPAWIIARELCRARGWHELLRPDLMSTCYMNRALLRPLSHWVDHTSEPQVTAQQTLAYLRQVGFAEGRHVTIADAGSFGSLIKAVKTAFANAIDISAIFLISENLAIPSYVTRILAETWHPDREDERTMRHQYIVRDYLEDRFGEYIYRPEKYRERMHDGRSVLIPECRSTPPHNQLSAWASRQAMKHAAAVMVLRQRFTQMVFDEVARRALTYMFEWWLKTTRDPNEPNLMFYNWPKWPGGEAFLDAWDDSTLVSLLLD